MITIFIVAQSLNITDRRILQKAGALLQESDKAKGIKREKIEQVEGKKTFRVNAYPESMEIEIQEELKYASYDIEKADKEKAERIKAEKERLKMLVEAVPVDLIAQPKKRKLVPRIKRPKV